jgi:large subunit ribosomal protein L23
MARTKKVATEATETKVTEKVATEVVEKPAKKVAAKKPVKAKAVAAKETKTETTATAVKSKATLSSFATIIRPIITEKSMKGIEKQQKITVEVDGNANKTAIKLAFEATYQVKVKKVNVVNVLPKYTRRGQYPGTISGYKKAIVTLVSGQALDVFKE